MWTFIAVILFCMSLTAQCLSHFLNNLVLPETNARNWIETVCQVTGIRIIYQKYPFSFTETKTYTPTIDLFNLQQKKTQKIPIENNGNNLCWHGLYLRYELGLVRDSICIYIDFNLCSKCNFALLFITYLNFLQFCYHLESSRT